MANKILKVSSCYEDIFLNFHSDKVLEKTIKSDFMKKFIPNSEISETKVEGSPKIDIYYDEKFNLEGEYPSFTYYGDNYRDILYLSQFMFERKRQETGKYGIHSSCAEDDSGAVVLFGWKDSGKTSVAIHLAKEYGFLFSSESRTIIDRDLNVVGRIKFLEEDNGFLKKKYNFGGDCLDISKICNLSSDKKTPLDLMIYPQITGDSLIVREWDNQKALYHMYELFSYGIRGVAKNINDYNCPLQSLDTIELAKQRTEFVKDLVNKKKVIQIRGNIDDICKEIIRQKSI